MKTDDCGFVQNAVPAPRPPALPESNSGVLRPVPISELGRDSSVEWVWEGYLSPNHITLLVGLWKSGKSTLLAHVLKLLCTGGELGGGVHPAKVLLLTEESEAIWADRRDEIGIGDSVHVVCRPFLRRPDFDEWRGLIGELRRLVRDEGYKAVVFDPIPSLWPVTRENDAGQIVDALVPLQGLAGAGTAILLLHHPSKSDATEGRASRGSGALTGFVDVILEFRRFDPERREDRRRVLTAYSRFSETPDETVLELTDAGYVCCGTKADVKRTDRLAVITDLLPRCAPGLTVEDVLKVWPVGNTVPKPGLRTVRNDLQHAFGAGTFGRSGDGKKQSPYRFWVSDSIPASSVSYRPEPNSDRQDGSAVADDDDSDRREREAIMSVEADAARK